MEAYELLNKDDDVKDLIGHSKLKRLLALSGDTNVDWFIFPSPESCPESFVILPDLDSVTQFTS